MAANLMVEDTSLGAFQLPVNLNIKSLESSANQFIANVTAQVNSANPGTNIQPPTLSLGPGLVSITNPNVNAPNSPNLATSPNYALYAVGGAVVLVAGFLVYRSMKRRY